MTARADIDICQHVLYEDAEVIVLNKPPDLPSTGRTLDDKNCAQWLLMCRERRPVWAIHQLDANTSGVLIFVRRKALVQPWHARIKPPLGQKTYLAVCHGVPADVDQTIDAPLGWREGAYGVCPDGKPSRTRARLLAAAADGLSSLVAVDLITGRTHQARVHLAHVGLPLYGEAFYMPCGAHPRHALHAARVRFEDGPTCGAFCAPFPDDLARLCDRLGLPQPPEPAAL
jgi:23S rRNA-/tRNA-specific pseudouridylate synthase